jgi:hypothetical protein
MLNFYVLVKSIFDEKVCCAGPYVILPCYILGEGYCFDYFGPKYRENKTKFVNFVWNKLRFNMLKISLVKNFHHLETGNY